MPLPLRVRAYRSLVVARMVVVIYAGYKVLQLLGALTGRSRRPHYYDSQNRRSAVLIRDTAVRLQGLLIKACQFAGSRADILPPEYVEILSELQDKVPPKEFTLIAPWIEEQLGRRLSDCFSSIDAVPVAAASLAQVHKAILADGRTVAVKVQYPEIERIISTDLANFSFFVNLLARLERRFDLRLLLREIKKYIPLELDFVNEAANARKFAANFDNDPAVIIPIPVAELCCRTVLTMNYIEGIKISDIAALERAGIDKHAVAELLTKTYIWQILVHGFFHGDPHPGNLLVRPGPQLVMLDLGLAKEFTPELRAGVVKLTRAIVTSDARGIGEAFRDLGFETRSGGDDTFLTLAEIFLGQALKAKQAYADVSMLERMGDELMAALRENPIIRASSDLLLVLRVMGLLSGIGKQLDSKVDPMAAMLPFLGSAQSLAS